jgi:hypothetical protein
VGRLDQLHLERQFHHRYLGHLEHQLDLDRRICQLCLGNLVDRLDQLDLVHLGYRLYRLGLLDLVDQLDRLYLE